MWFKKLNDGSGFTLAELLVAMTITGVLMAAIYSAYMSQKKSYKIQSDTAAVQQNLRAAMYYLQREVRMAGYNPRGTASVGFTNISSSTQSNISFSWDANENGTYDAATELISYRYNAGIGTLERQVGTSGWQVVAEKITGASFTFLDSSGNPTMIAGNVRSVNIALTASEGTHSRQLSCEVVCRNIGL